MEEKRESSNFIEAEINKDIENNVYEGGRVLTRFPPNLMVTFTLDMLKASS